MKFKTHKKDFFAKSVHQLPERLIESCASTSIFANEDDRVFLEKKIYLSNLLVNSLFRFFQFAVIIMMSKLKELPLIFT